MHAVVRGVVQGVGFRYWVQREAHLAGLSGWVRNREDGAVECSIQGARPAVTAMVEKLRRGPMGAAVAAVDIQWQAPDDLGGGNFEIFL